MKNLVRVIQIAIPFIWFGALGAISFMEAPLKFTAPNITIPLGLGIGRIVFQTLNKIEIVFALLLFISIFTKRPKGKFPLVSFGVILLLLILETVWLLPVLDARATEVINGTAAPFSNAHHYYIAFDAIKFLLLFALGVSLATQNLKFEQ
jgi:hypothetical protein